MKPPLRVDELQYNSTENKLLKCPNRASLAAATVLEKIIFNKLLAASKNEDFNYKLSPAMLQINPYKNLAKGH